MKIIGLTGGIASGKSAVSSVLKEAGAFIIDADQIARDIVRPGEPGYAAVMDTFGAEYFLPGGELNRAKLGALVFSDSAARLRLDRLLHPLIIRKAKEKIARTAKETVVIDAALLIETSLHKLADEVWLVTAPRETRIRRMMERDGVSRHEAIKRIDSQAKDAWRKQYANRVLKNNGDLARLKEEVQMLYKSFQYK
ncbi:MAG: dephospho-CoA kinase [Christensenellales bacterium]